MRLRGTRHPDEVTPAMQAGVVLSTFPPGNPRNRSNRHIECDVILYSTREIVRNAIVLQQQEGIANIRNRWVPIPTSNANPGLVAGKDAQNVKTPNRPQRLDELNGENVIVGFLTNYFAAPVIMAALVHPNTTIPPVKQSPVDAGISVYAGTIWGVRPDGRPVLNTDVAAGGATSGPIATLGDNQTITLDFPGASTLVLSAATGDVTATHSRGGRVDWYKAGGVKASSDAGSFVDIKGDGNVSVVAPKSIDTTSTDQTIITSGSDTIINALKGNVDIDSTGDVTVDGVNAAVTATTKATVTAPAIDLTGAVSVSGGISFVPGTRPGGTATPDLEFGTAGVANVEDFVNALQEFIDVFKTAVLVPFPPGSTDTYVPVITALPGETIDPADLVTAARAVLDQFSRELP